MTQSEYEAKKRECWEEYCRTHKTLINGDDTYLIEYEAFDYAFDRAYALGKQKETITQKEIEKAAEAFAKPFFGSGGIFTPNQVKNLLIAFVKQYLGKQEKDADTKTNNENHSKNTSQKSANLRSDADTVIQGWVFVDETTFDRHLCVRKVTQGDYKAVWDSGHPEFCLGPELYPDMVPNSLPEPVEIIIKRKKNG